MYKSEKLFNMKKLRIFTVLFATFLLFSCNDKLDLQTDGRITMDQVFSDYNRTRGYLNSCYGYCPAPYMDRASFTDEAQDADDVTPGSRYVNWYGGSVTSITYPAYSSDASPWGSLYTGIRKCNVFLESIKTATVYATDEEKGQWTAQALTLRALYYLQLIKRYGGVPIIDKPLEINHDFSKDKRATFSEVVKFILADCDKALTYPATQTGFAWNIYDNQFGIMSRAVAYAIKSQAVTYAASPLWSDGTYTWAMATEINKEALYQCMVNGGYKLFDVVPASNIAQNPYALYFFTSSNDQRAVDKETIYQRGDVMQVWRWAGMPTNPSMDRTGPCPTQDLVDSYEMANGEAPISGYSDASRLNPIVNPASGYNPNNPYEGRDPRFYASVYYNGASRFLDQAGDQTAGLKFTATAPFYAVAAVCPSWGNNIGNLTFRLFKWNTNYALSVAGTPVAENTFVNFTDGASLMLTFGAQPAGDYLWELSRGTETVGVWKYNETVGTSVSYYMGKQVSGNYHSLISYTMPLSATALTSGSSNTPVGLLYTAVTQVETFVGGKEEISDISRKNTRTGYYLRKFNNYKSTLSNSADGAIRLFRLGELMLNFAESAYQSAGPDVAVTAGSISISARDAVNAVRARAGMPPFPAGMAKDAFEKKYRNERRIELAFEEHRFFDVRRWKVLDQTDKFVTGMRITKSGTTLTYTRFKFTDRNCYSTKWLMYPIDQAEVDKVIGFSGANWQNPGWLD
jgi:hypothetical protein